MSRFDALGEGSLAQSHAKGDRCPETSGLLVAYLLVAIVDD